MSEYDGYYVKLANSPAHWAVDDGERREVANQQEIFEIGLRKVRTISQEQMDAIPVRGEHESKRKKARKPADEEPDAV